MHQINSENRQLFRGKCIWSIKQTIPSLVLMFENQEIFPALF